MKIKISQQILQEAIRVVSRLAPPTVTGNVTIESDGKKLFMHSASELNRCSINLPCDVSGKPATFAIELQALKDATKGRAEMEILFEKTMCKISSGQFRIELSTTDALEQESEKEADKKQSFKLDAEQAQALKSALTTVALKPTALLASYMPVYIKMGEKGTFVTCYDNNHAAFLNTKELKGNMEVDLPLDIMMSVLDAFDKSGMSVSVGAASLNVSSKLIKVSLTLPQEEENALRGGAVHAQAKEISKVDGKEVTASRTAILEYLDNARAVSGKERNEITLTTSAKGKLKLEVTTVKGSAKAVIAANCSNESVSKVDFEFFDEAVRKSTEEVSMKVVDNAFISFKIKNATVLVSLNQE